MHEGSFEKDRIEKQKPKQKGSLVKTLGAAGLASLVGTTDLPNVSAAEAYAQPVVAVRKVDKLKPAASYKERLREREKQDEAYFLRLARDPIARKLFQEAPTQKELGAVMRSLAKTNAKWINAFKRDEKRMHNGALALHTNWGQFVGNGTILKVPDRRKVSGQEYRHIVATASHVADHVPPPPGTSWTRHPKGRDVAVRDLSESERTSVATGTTGALLFRPDDDKDITGEVGAVIAHDDDEGPLARKLYPSRISPFISSHVLRTGGIKPEEYPPQYDRDDYAAMRIVVLPPGQAVKPKDKKEPVKGVSGGAFVYMPRGSAEPAFGGMFVAAARIYEGFVMYEAGLVIDRSYVRETLEEHFGK